MSSGHVVKIVIVEAKDLPNTNDNSGDPPFAYVKVNRLLFTTLISPSRITPD